MVLAQNTNLTGEGHFLLTTTSVRLLLLQRRSAHNGLDDTIWNRCPQLDGSFVIEM